MNPDINPQEYLDQISVKKPGRFNFLDKKILILVVSTVLLIIAIAAWLALSSAPKQSLASELLSIRMQNMNSLLEYDSSKITDSNSKKDVAETKVIFASNYYRLNQNLALTTDQSSLNTESIDTTIDELDRAANTNDLSKQYILTLRNQINLIVASLNEAQIDNKNVTIEQTLLDLAELSNRLHN